MFCSRSGSTDEHLAHRDAVVDREQLGVELAEALGRAGAADSSSGRPASMRREAVQAPGLHALEDVFLEHAGALRRSRAGVGGRPSSWLSSLTVRSSSRCSSWMRRGTRHRPAAVAEVALELAGDGRRRERRELQPAIGLEPLDRLEQTDERDLAQVVGRLAAVRETPRRGTRRGARAPRRARCGACGRRCGGTR